MSLLDRNPDERADDLADARLETGAPLHVRTVPLRHDRPGRPSGGWAVICSWCGPVPESVRPHRDAAWLEARDHAALHTRILAGGR